MCVDLGPIPFPALVLVGDGASRPAGLVKNGIYRPRGVVANGALPIISLLLTHSGSVVLFA